MHEPSYTAAPVAVRADLVEAHRRAWQRLAGPGTWWTGEERVAIAAETRAARQCALCSERRRALSPSAARGRHDSTQRLPEPLVEVIHRVTTDPGRLSRAVYEQALEGGVADTSYVEAIGVLVRTVSIDFFCRAMGVPPHPLPAPVPGEPSRRRPEGAAPAGAWVPMLPHGRGAGPEADLYAEGRPPNVMRALSLVPDEVRGIQDLAAHQYLPPRQIADPTQNGGRALSRAQIELVAGRVSALNECFY